ncbi:Hypoxia-inducible factor 1-alpha inhibitor [Symbiodinium microadriaticum]|uniref:Hypoxia-inducible factor 1-alpha inhibitor n=1 Tax=Symbiodinium microadriaticum TaxID=2951 RepID=A0A1Q9CA77_SYMMI|nr:Hypoxia-inducible factor 1-alpha inhibitor [Symbiodinium microadriaticum]
MRTQRDGLRLYALEEETAKHNSSNYTIEARDEQTRIDTVQPPGVCETPGHMALGVAKANCQANSDITQMLIGGYSASAAVPTPAPAAARVPALPSSAWPGHYKPIRRVKFTSVDEVLELMKPQSAAGAPLIIEGSSIIQAEKWEDVSHVKRLWKDRQVLVKKSPNSKFRYFDLKKNSGKFTFKQPVRELQDTFATFLEQANRILSEGSPERMYLQETLSGHSEMAEEFASWKWELPIRISHACGWGLPDSNELFIGMQGAETPLHFDERENLFFQVRGLKEIVVFPFVDYSKLYPFPTTHPCDRQSMVGSPLEADLDAFPKFRHASGHYATLQAGDLLYLPYGWWHWLRNLDNMAISVSFWSTTPATDLSGGVPSEFSDHMLTRVKRNLESLVAQKFGPESLDETMLKLQSIVRNKQDDPVLNYVRELMAAVKIPAPKQDDFLLEIIEGRFGIDWNTYV